MKIKRRQKLEKIVVLGLAIFVVLTGILVFDPLPDVESIQVENGGLLFKVPAIVIDLNQRFIRGHHDEED